MKAIELRIGNLTYYHVEDKFEGERNVLNYIDYEDLRVLFRNKDENYRPIPLTEEWLLKFGFVIGSLKNCYFKAWGKNGIESIVYEYHYKGGFEYELGSHKFKVIESVHQLQNLYFALTGEELTIR